MEYRSRFDSVTTLQVGSISLAMVQINRRLLLRVGFEIDSELDKINSPTCNLSG